jgi:hypothetical protein
MMRLWAKREEQIRCVVESTAGLYGDLQRIAGRSLLEIDGLAHIKAGRLRALAVTTATRLDALRQKSCVTL